jgi:hypothetical protein
MSARVVRPTGQRKIALSGDGRALAGPNWTDLPVSRQKTSEAAYRVALHKDQSNERRPGITSDTSKA